MKIHEYQGKEIFRNSGVPVPEGFPAFNVEEAVNAFEKLGTEKVVVKAQIHAGGRGKGGGVKLVSGSEEVRKTADEILGMNLITHQTGSSGKVVYRLYIEQAVDIEREIYLALVLDRNKQRFVFITSTEGGIDIEELAATKPESIIRLEVEPAAVRTHIGAAWGMRFSGATSFG